MTRIDPLNSLISNRSANVRRLSFNLFQIHVETFFFVYSIVALSSGPFLS